MRPLEGEDRQRRCNESTRIPAGQGWSLGEVIDRLFGPAYGLHPLQRIRHVA